MRLIATSCLLLLSSLMGAQTPTVGAAQALVCDGPKVCSGGYTNGHLYETMFADNKIGLLVSLEVVGKYVRADIFVFNNSSFSVDVLPSNIVLTEVTPKQKVLKYVDGDKLIRSAEKRLALGNALTSVGANMQRQQSSVTTRSTGTISTVGSNGATAGSYNGTSTSTISTPNYAAQAQAAETIRTRNEAFVNTADFASRTTLRANTVPPGGRLRGYMFFKRDKKGKLVMLSGIVGNTVYQFPFLLEAKP